MYIYIYLASLGGKKSPIGDIVDSSVLYARADPFPP